MASCILQLAMAGIVKGSPRSKSISQSTLLIYKPLTYISLTRWSPFVIRSDFVTPHMHIILLLTFSGMRNLLQLAEPSASVVCEAGVELWLRPIECGEFNTRTLELAQESRHGCSFSRRGLGHQFVFKSTMRE